MSAWQGKNDLQAGDRAKASREARYWLRVAVKLGKVTVQEVEWELKEAGELRAKSVAAIKTAQGLGPQP